MASAPPISDEMLFGLAPLELPIIHNSRYGGADRGVSLADFIEEDRQTLERLYACLGGLMNALQPEVASGEALSTMTRSDELHAVMRAMRSFGRAPREGGGAPVFQRAVHDLRGGALAPLWLDLQVAPPELGEDEATRLFQLTRDHRKIMRNCVRDLDPAARAADLSHKLHDVQLITEKWSERELLPAREGASLVRVLVDCRYEGSVATSCLEFSSLDRVLYNLLNNAAAHAARSPVHLVILGTPPANTQSLRFVVLNEVRSEHHVALRERFGDDLCALWDGGFTTGGTGLGMSICADFVARAYGLNSVARGVHEGYVGAKLIGDRFIAWAHWPVCAD